MYKKTQIHIFKHDLNEQRKQGFTLNTLLCFFNYDASTKLYAKVNSRFEYI